MKPINLIRGGRPVDSYLNSYAEKEIASIPEDCVRGHYENVLCIPVRDEGIEFLNRLLNSSLRTDVAKRNLMILVVNQEMGSSSRQGNAAIFDLVMKLCHHCDATDNVHWFAMPAECEWDVLLIDRFSEANQIHPKEGVGKARKIAADIAVALIAQETVTTPFIYCSDADAHLPDDYFKAKDTLEDSENLAAITFDFSHQACEDKHVFDATQEYEEAIKYYRNALAWAGSYYAYTTLGSTLCINFTSYCKVRGFPRRAGAEDFYILNKLRKVGRIENLTSVTITLDSRTSNRVPFGTGPAVERIKNDFAQGKAMHYFAFENFQRLRQLLLVAADELHASITKPCEEVLSMLEPKIAFALRALDFASFWHHAQNQVRNQEQFTRAFHTWFDAFRTLKFIRLLESAYYPAQPLRQCIENLGLTSSRLANSSLAHDNL